MVSGDEVQSVNFYSRAANIFPYRFRTNEQLIDALRESKWDLKHSKNGNHAKLEKKIKEFKDTLVVKNLGLVGDAASKFYTKRILNKNDLVSEGVFGLMESIDAYIPNPDVLFSTFAYMRIKKAIRSAVFEHTLSAVKLPYHAAVKLINYYNLDEDTKATASLEEVSKELGTSPDLLKNLLLTSSKMSIDASLSKNGEKSFLLDIPSDDFYKPDVRVQEKSTAGYLNTVMESSLTKREQGIINLRYGLGNTVPHKFREIAKMYGVTLERIRQIHGDSIKKLNSALTGSPQPQKRKYFSRN